MSKNIVVYNKKGGTSKSTTSVNISFALSKMGYKTLLVDCDTQAHSSKNFLGVRKEVNKTLLNIINGDSLESCIHKTDLTNLFILGANINLNILDVKLGSGNFLLLKKSLISNNFDYIIFDLSPAENNILISCLCLSSLVLIPITPEFFAFESSLSVSNKIKDIQEDFNNSMKIRYFETMVNKSFDVHNKISLKIKEVYKSNLLSSVIRQDSNIKKSQIEGKSIFEYKADSKASEDYVNLVKEILEVI